MSPVVLIKRPFSNAFTIAFIALFVGSPGIVSNSIAPTKPIFLISITCG